MGQKCHPIGFRVGITEGWKSRWYAPKPAFGTFLVEDEMIRKYPEDNQWFYIKAETCEEAGRLLDALNAWEAYVRIWEKLDKKMRNPGENEVEQLRNGKAKVRELRARLNKVS